MYRIGFIGSGKMAAALLSAILESKTAGADEVICSDAATERRQEIQSRYAVKVTESNREVMENSELTVLAFKPQNFPEAVAGLASVVQPEQIIVSILAGVRIEQIHRHLPGRAVRVMPNTGCLVGEMAAGFAVGPGVTPADRERVRAILECAGTAVEVEEEKLDAVTGLSGSGPAFVAYLIDSFIQAGVTAGLTETAARDLSLKTFGGTARLLREQELTPQELIEMVSSPGGTTVAGREILESSDIHEVIKQTVRRAAERSRELGKG
jgi:pyrroline-5-carboxylate reductase